MTKINVSDLRQHLPTYLRRVQSGEELAITSRGQVVARLVPERDLKTIAKAHLSHLRKTAIVHDVESPIAAAWEASDDSP